MLIFWVTGPHTGRIATQWRYCKQSKDWRGQIYHQPLLLRSEISLFWRTSCARDFFLYEYQIKGFYKLYQSMQLIRHSHCTEASAKCFTCQSATFNWEKYPSCKRLPELSNDNLKLGDNFTNSYCCCFIVEK